MVLAEEDLHVQVLVLSSHPSCCLGSFPTLRFSFCSLRSDKEESSDLKNYVIKAQNVKKKREILSSVYAE